MRQWPTAVLYVASDLFILKIFNCYVFMFLAKAVYQRVARVPVMVRMPQFEKPCPMPCYGETSNFREGINIITQLLLLILAFWMCLYRFPFRQKLLRSPDKIFRSPIATKRLRESISIPEVDNKW